MQLYGQGRDLSRTGVFQDRNEGALYSCLAHEDPMCPHGIFQGILATYRGNPLFATLINDFRNLPIDGETGKFRIPWYYFVKAFYFHLSKAFQCKPDIGWNKCKNGGGFVYLFVEQNSKKDDDDRTDRWGGFYYVFNKSGQRVMRSRDPAFPW